MNKILIIFYLFICQSAMKVLEPQDSLSQQNQTDKSCEQIENLMKVVLQKGLEFTTSVPRCKCFI